MRRWGRMRRWDDMRCWDAPLGCAYAPLGTTLGWLRRWDAPLGCAVGMLRWDAPLGQDAPQGCVTGISRCDAPQGCVTGVSGRVSIQCTPPAPRALAPSLAPSSLKCVKPTSYV